jgi:integrase/recombinase XerC
MSNPSTYHQILRENFDRMTADLLSILPSEVTGFVNTRYQKLAPRTRHAYVQDIYIFYCFLLQSDPEHNQDTRLTAYNLDVLASVTTDQLLSYVSWLKEYQLDGKTHHNAESGIRRKLSSLSSYFRYLAAQGYVSGNPVLVFDINDLLRKANSLASPEKYKPNSSLDPCLLYKAVELDSNQDLTPQQKVFHPIIVKRDRLILHLLIDTGIQVSDLVSLDLDDISFEKFRIRLQRTGSESVYIYLNDYNADLLFDYLKNGRDYFRPDEASSNALLLSRRHKRITARAIEQLVSRYGKLAYGEDVHITPAMLRKAFAEQVYAETRDLYLVTSALHRKSLYTGLDQKSEKDRQKELAEMIRRQK